MLGIMRFLSVSGQVAVLATPLASTHAMTGQKKYENFVNIVVLAYKAGSIG